MEVHANLSRSSLQEIASELLEAGAGRHFKVGEVGWSQLIRFAEALEARHEVGICRREVLLPGPDVVALGVNGYQEGPVVIGLHSARRWLGLFHRDSECDSDVLASVRIDRPRGILCQCVRLPSC